MRRIDRPRARALCEIAVITAATCSTWLLFVPSDGPVDQRLALTAAAAAGWLVAVGLALRGAPPRTWLAVGAVLVALGTAFVKPPQTSQDLWSYVMQGRALAIHGESPYKATPSDFAGSDPYVERVAPRWRTTQSPYGPLFTAISATGARLGDDSPLANRWFHQGLTLATVGAALLLVPARRRVVPLLVLGACPATVMIVNGGHNDLLVGLGVATAVWAFDRRKLALATGALAGAALVKLTALFALPFMAWWAWRRGARRSSVLLVVSTSLVVALGYVLAGGMTALRPLLSAAGHTTRASVWSALHRSLESDVDIQSLAKIGPLVVLSALGLLVAVRYRDRPSTGPLVVGALVAQVATLPWLMPWYVGWLLPAAAAQPDEEPSLLAVALTSALLVGYAVPPGVPGPPVVGAMSSAVLPAFFLVAAVVLLTGRARSETTATVMERL